MYWLSGGRVVVIYAQVESSHPVGANDESVTGCTGLVETELEVALELV